VTRPHAADDFATIREQMNELRRATATAPLAQLNQRPHAETLLTGLEHRLKDRPKGFPALWVPTIFLAADEALIFKPARLPP
jgi:hypothetical protein